MKDQLRQMAVIVTIITTLVVNVLANALPLNGLNTGQFPTASMSISSRRATCFPSGA